MKLFFCGSALTYKALNKYKGEAPSATQWITGFLKGFIENNTAVKNFSPVWDAMFPKGFLFPGSTIDLITEFDSNLIKYLNIAKIRDIHIAHNIYKMLCKEIATGNVPDVIITYNLYPRYTKALNLLKSKYPNIKWISLILDADDPRLDNWKYIKKQTRKSDGVVFLSWWGYENAPIKNKLHIDSGWTGELSEPIINNEKVFVYAGKMVDDGSFSDLIEAIKLVKDKNVRFEFYGKGMNKDLIKLSQEDTRVQIKGFVTNEELDTACRSAIAFLSPRDDKNQENIMVFPSKILVYLKYLKPIISPDLPGISPEYKHVLHIVKDNTSEQWAKKMEEILRYGESQFSQTANQSKKLLEDKKWKKQTKKIIDFISFIE